MKVSAQVANFNVVFGNEERPMLDYFDSIIYPAFLSEIEKSGKNQDTYFFREIEVIKNKNGDAAIIGRIIKRTILEVFSDLNERGDLVEKDEHYSSAPYSTFIIYLRNHRMLFVPNQKGSPTLTNFKSAVEYILKKFISNYNSKNEKKLPYVLVNIVGVPSAKSLEELLKTVKKINSLTLKFYPLNGDVDFSDVFGIMSTDLRKAVGSKTGQIVLNSPKSMGGVVGVLQQAGGTINPILRVTTSEDTVVKLQDDQMTEKYEMEMEPKLTLEQKKKQIIDKANEIDTLRFTTDNHDRIYERNRERIMSVARKQ